MAQSNGGIWTAGSYSKVLPGAYFNIKSAPSTSSDIATKGTVALIYDIAVPSADVDTVDEATLYGKFIEIEKSDYISGAYADILGFVTSDSEAYLLNQLFNYATTAQVLPKYSWVADVADADATTADAEKAWTLVSSTITAGVSAVYVYERIVGTIKTTRTITWTATATTLAKFTQELYNITFDVAVIDSKNEFDTSLEIQAFVSAIVDLRNNYGKQVKGVVTQDIDDTDTASGLWYINKVHNIINFLDGDGIVRDAYVWAVIVAAMDAGALYNESNTAKVITGMSKLCDENGNDFNPYVSSTISGEDTQSLEDEVASGFFAPCYRDDGVLIVCSDVNCLTEDIVFNGYNINSDIFKKNRPTRVISQLITDMSLKWKTSFMGKVTNNDKNRGIFKAYCINYLEKIQANDGIENFDRNNDIQIIASPDASKKDAVVMNLYVQPLDSMEKLYGTFTVA